MNNLGIRQAKNQMINFLNGLPFDIEVKRLLLKDLYDEVKDEADRQVLKENQEAQKALAEAKEKKDGKETDE